MITGTATGKVIEVGEPKTFSEKYSARTLVIESGDKWPQTIPFDFANARMQSLDKVEVGEVVEVDYSIKGRKWNDRYFVSLEGTDVRWVTENDKPQPQADGLPF